MECRSHFEIFRRSFTFEGRLLNITGFMRSDIFWSLFAMPIGTILCFGPAIVAWLLSDWSEPEETPRQNKH